MIRESWIGDHVELSQVRQCSLAGVSRATVYACWRRLNIDLWGVQLKTWTGLRHKSETLSVF